MNCEECQRAYEAANTPLPGERELPKKKEPPCETCKPAELMPENFAAMQIYDRCGDEWIRAGEEGAIMALPSQSIEAAMNLSGIFDQAERQRVYDQVKMLSRAVVVESAKEREKRRAEREAAK